MPFAYVKLRVIGLQDERKLREVLRFANACGAITTTKKGAIPAMPNEEEALKFLDTV